MELDDFKQRFKENIPAETVVHSAHDLERYTRKRTGSVILKIKRNMLLEMASCLLFVAVAIWAWFSYPVLYVRAFCLLTAALCVFMSMYMAALYKKISQFEQAAPDVRKSLQQVIAILGQFTRVYFQFTMITLPVAFIFGIITGFIDVNNAGIKHFNTQKAIVFYTAWFIFWSAVMYFFSKWYIKKLYGNYLNALKEQLKDIENG